MYYFKAAVVSIATAISTDNFPKVNADNARLQVILSVFFGILAAAALLILVISGLRYVSSTGDPNAMTKTKNTIIYSAIGLIVSMSAYAIVSFVLGNI